MSAGVRRAGTLAAWAPHIACVVVAAAMCAVAIARHVTADEAMAVAFDDAAPTGARIRAMQIAANRARERDARLGEGLAAAFLSSDDERLREAALLMDLARHHDGPGRPPLQAAYVARALAEEGWTAHTLIARTIHRRKVGGPRYGGMGRMDRAEAGWFLEAMRTGEVPPPEVRDAYVRAREARTRAVLRQRDDLLDGDD